MWTGRGMIMASDFPTRSAICRRNEPFWPAPPHIQLSYETNPFRSCGSDAPFAPCWRERIAHLPYRAAGNRRRVTKDRFNVVLETGLDALALSTVGAPRL